MIDIKVLLLDLDGTLLYRDQVLVSDRNMRAIRAAISTGITVVPCTGRVFDMFPPALEAETSIRYFITCHGARVVDRVDRRTLYECVMTPEASAAVCRVFEDRGIYAEVAANATIYMEKEILDKLSAHCIPPHHVWYFEAGRTKPVTSLSRFFVSSGSGIEKVNLYGIPDNLQREIHDALRQTGAVRFTRDTVGKDAELSPLALNKVDAASCLLKHLGASFEETMAIGDSGSDWEILRRARIGVAMGNAPEALRAAADDVTAVNEADGVAFAIEKYLLK